MPNVLKYSFFFLLLSSIAACCTEKDCSDISNIRSISFIDFEEDEIDTVQVQVFNGNTLVEDYNVAYNSYDKIIWLNDFLDINYTYVIYIQTLQKQYILSDFTTKKFKCNTGFMCRDYRKNLSSYKVNNNVRNDYKLTIYKED